MSEAPWTCSSHSFHPPQKLWLSLPSNALFIFLYHLLWLSTFLCRLFLSIENRHMSSASCALVHLAAFSSCYTNMGSTFCAVSHRVGSAGYALDMFSVLFVSCKLIAGSTRRIFSAGLWESAVFSHQETHPVSLSLFCDVSALRNSMSRFVSSLDATKWWWSIVTLLQHLSKKMIFFNQRGPSS